MLDDKQTLARASAPGKADRRQTGASPDAPHVSEWRYAIQALRPTQWTKNGLVLLALVFSHRLFDLAADARVLLAFLAFSLASGVVYIINDLGDRAKDQLHPRKRLRPIASGRLSSANAIRTAALAGVGACFCAILVVTDAVGFAFAHWFPGAHQPARPPDPFRAWGGAPTLFLVAIASYVAINFAYTYWLKHEVLLDVFIIAAGFVLRAVAGALAIPVPISPWFYLCTLFLALFLALGKRRAELLLLREDAANHRNNLQAYTLPLLDQLLGILVTCSLITYSLYTFQAATATHTLMLTIPLVVFGMFRYLYLLYAKGQGDRPDEMLWRDKQILACVALYIGVALAVLYIIP